MLGKVGLLVQNLLHQSTITSQQTVSLFVGEMMH
jgi:hypothetical protein